MAQNDPTNGTKITVVTGQPVDSEHISDTAERLERSFGKDNVSITNIGRRYVGEKPVVLDVHDAAFQKSSSFLRQSEQARRDYDAIWQQVHRAIAALPPGTVTVIHDSITLDQSALDKAMTPEIRTALDELQKIIGMR